MLKVRSVKHEKPQVFILLLLAGINKLVDNLIHDLKLGFMVYVKISSVQLSFGIIHTLIKKSYLLMPLLFAQQLWIWNEYFSGLIFENDLKFFSDCNDYIQAEYLNLDYNITSDLHTIHCYSWCNCQITHLATIHIQCYFIIKLHINSLLVKVSQTLFSMMKCVTSNANYKYRFCKQNIKETCT